MNNAADGKANAADGGQGSNVLMPIEPDHERPGDVPAPAGSISVSPNGNICGLAFVDPALAAAVRPDDPEQFIRQFSIVRIVLPGISTHRSDGGSRFYFGAASVLTGRTTTPQEASFRSEYPAACLNDGSNVLLTQEVAMRPDGRPYTVALTIRQGRKFARETIVRAPDALAEPYNSTLRGFEGEEIPENLSRRIELSIMSDLAGLYQRANSLFDRGN